MMKSKLYALLMLGMVPLLTGCAPAAVGVAYGSVLWLDIALIPVRSAIGTATLNFINGV